MRRLRNDKNLSFLDGLRDLFDAPTSLPHGAPKMILHVLFFHRAHQYSLSQRIRLKNLG
jgi:hypothetical protein